MTARVRRQDAGFTLVEMVLSAAIMCAVVVVLLHLAAMAQQSVQSQGDLADLQQRVRVASIALYRDLVMAGAGPSQGSARGRLAAVFAPIVPARTGARGADRELSHGDDRISIVYVPETSSQTRLAADMASPGAPLVIDTASPGCPPDGACGFAAGDRALVFDTAGSGAYDIFGVATAGHGRLASGLPLSATYRAGSAVVAVVQRVYYLDRAAGRVMQYDGGLGESPLIDHVADMRFRYYASSGGATGGRLLTAAEMTDGPVRGAAPNRFDADLLTIGRVRVTMTLEAPGLFRGRDARLRRTEVTFDVTPRNMSITAGS